MCYYIAIALPYSDTSDNTPTANYPHGYIQRQDTQPVGKCNHCVDLQ